MLLVPEPLGRIRTALIKTIPRAWLEQSREIQLIVNRGNSFFHQIRIKVCFDCSSQYVILKVWLFSTSIFWNGWYNVLDIFFQWCSKSPPISLPSGRFFNYFGSPTLFLHLLLAANSIAQISITPKFQLEFKAIFTRHKWCEKVQLKVIAS